MQPNPYAPPKAEVDDVVAGAIAPPLWNPNAAASWSLLFSPAFGAFLHMKNWQALGEPGKAAASRTWVIVSIAVLLASTLLAVFLPASGSVDGLSRIVGLALLLSWYFSSAKPQVVLIKSRFGNSYPRKGWAKPLLLAVVALIAFVALAVVASLLAGTFASGA